MVKGVAWDPIGRYIASQGDDRAAIIWDAREWRPAARIEAPFQRTSQKTLYRRLCWSGDGQFLCCPHAFKKPVNIATVLKRPAAGSEWKEECDFVGHTDPVVCAAFNPRAFRRAPLPAPPPTGAEGDGAPAAADAAAAGGAAARKQSTAAYSCCALGAQDCTLSIWLTSSPRPLLVVRQLFEQVRSVTSVTCVACATCVYMRYMRYMRLHALHAHVTSPA